MRRNTVSASKLNTEKAELYEKMERGRENMFITGKAGAGKSYLLNYFTKNTEKNILKMAPTGMAALNIGGQTIHSLLRMGREDYYDLTEIRKANSEIGKRLRVLVRHADTIIIDEVSMVSANMMDAIDCKIQTILEKNHVPFGGKQVIFFGDPYQLPPVIPEKAIEIAMRRDYRGGIYFFKAPAFEHKELHKYELSEIFRQKDDTFVNILNKIRVGEATEEDLSILNTKAQKLDLNTVNTNCLILTPYRNRARQVNRMRLSEIDEPEYYYYADIEGDFGPRSNYPAEECLVLKKGAQVMMIMNDEPDEYGKRRWTNGTLGTISYLSPEMIVVNIDGNEHVLKQASWNKTIQQYDEMTGKIGEKVVARFWQYPLQLAYATTIHKAQGQTYEMVGIDMGRGAFDVGQTYVALSRCTSLENLYLARPILKRDIWVSPEVKKYMGKG